MTDADALSTCASNPIHDRIGEAPITTSPTPSANVSIPDVEMELLAYYLDNVFYRQFPFSRSQMTQCGRGWLLALLMGRGTSFYACLSLSTTYQLALLSPHNPAYESTRLRLMQVAQRYLSQAIGGMQTTIEQFVATQATLQADGQSTANLLFGMLQLIFLSVSR